MKIRTESAIGSNFEGNVMEKMRVGDFKRSVDAVVGTNSDEGTYWLPYYLADQKFGFQFTHTIG